MKVGMIQSNYIPWRGYFDFIDDVDLFVFYDDVQYTKQNWRNRNRIKTATGLEWLSVPVKATRETMIDEAEIVYDGKWVDNHIKKIALNYRDSPNIKQCLEGFSEILNCKYNTLSELNIALCKWIMDLFKIKTKLISSRSLGVPGDKYDRPLKILKKLNATSYLSGPVAKNYCDGSVFLKSGINLEYKSYKYLPYEQLWSSDFEPSVSVIDMICNVPSDQWRIYLKSQEPNYKLEI